MTIAGLTFTVLQGASFGDIPSDHFFFSEISNISARAITLGCDASNYCPDLTVTRQQMAAFIMRALGEFSPPEPPEQRFADVPPTNFFYRFIDRLAALEITLGCGTNPQGELIYCPEDAVTRQQMAAFIIRALGEFDPPEPPDQRFADVPPSNPFYRFIDRMAVLGITLGCGTNAEGELIYCPTDTVTRQQMAAFLTRAFRSANQPPVVSAGADKTISLPAAASLNGSFMDDGLPAGQFLTIGWSKVSGPGTVIFANSNRAVTTATFSQAGTYVLRLSIGDTQLTGTDDVTITVSDQPNQPPVVNAGPDQTITLPSTVTLDGTATDDGLPAGVLTIEWTKVSGPGAVLFSSASNTASTASFAVAGTNVLRLTASDSELATSDTVTITVEADPTPPPPDPETIAPQLDPGEASTLGDSTEFLYTGPNAIQFGVAPGTINKVRVSVLRGRVIGRDSLPIPNVEVSIQDHPELGHTFTRSDGEFDMAVNGGGMLSINFINPGLIPVQRTKNAEWQEFEMLDEVVMIAYDDRVSSIDLNSTVAVQVAQANPVTDSDGTRQATLMFKQGTLATMVLADGTTQPITNLHVRTTEFTVGAMGPKTMPGELPPTSSYTYAAEFSVDEAVAAGAAAVTFSQPAPFYVENFVGMPVGSRVPMAFYDAGLEQWVAEPDGRIIKVLSITGGLADLDTIGDGAADDAATLALLGINDSERVQLATLYSPNQELWRIPVQHFSSGTGTGNRRSNPTGDSSGLFRASGDGNNASQPPPDAEFANQPQPKLEDKQDNPTRRCGSIIECQNQALGEVVNVVGTPYTRNTAGRHIPKRQTGSCRVGWRAGRRPAISTTLRAI